MRPNVLIIIDTGIIGGPGKGLFQFLRCVKEDNLDYTLCCVAYKNPRSTEFIDAALNLNLNLRLIHQRFPFDPGLIFQAAEVASKAGCNIIQSHGYKSHLIAAAVSRMLKIPWLAMSHGWTSENWKVKLYHSLDAFLLKYPKIAVAVSPPLYESISKIRGPRKRTELLLNAIEDQANVTSLYPDNLRMQLGISEKELVLGCFGRLSTEKGQIYLLKALKKLNSAKLSPKLILAGSGPDKDALREYIDSNGLQEQVFMLEHQNNMRRLYEAIDMLVIPSLSEGLPNVLLESMALSKAAVATRVGAVPEVIEDGRNGWLVTPGCEEALAGTLERVLRDAGNLPEMGRQARTSLFPKFSAQRRAEKILKYYSEILEDRAA